MGQVVTGNPQAGGPCANLMWSLALKVRQLESGPRRQVIVQEAEFSPGGTEMSPVGDLVFEPSPHTQLPCVPALQAGARHRISKPLYP